MTSMNAIEAPPADPQAADYFQTDVLASSATPESLERHLEADRIGRMMRIGILGAVLEPVAATILCLALWSHVETKQAAFWLVLVWGAAALRAMFWYHSRRSEHLSENMRAWGNACVGAVTAGGALWAMAIIFLWPAQSLTHQLILVMAIVGVAGAVLASVASYMPAAMIYLASTVSVVLWGLLWRGIGDPTLVTGLSLAVAVTLLLFAWHIGRLLREQSQLRFDLAAAGETGESASRAKSQFIANMSHELRTPLNAILGFSELIRDEAFGAIAEPRYKSYAGDIHNSGNHLLDVINDILDLSKIEAGKMELTEESVDVARVIGQSINLMKDASERAGVLLKTVLPDRSLNLLGDERALKQILLNLLSNAIKFTPLGGEVVTEVKFAPTGDMILQLRDNGIGMAPDDIPRAMAPFGQVDGSLARKFEGTGLGLPLVKSLVERHGGEFRLTSELGVGTTAIASFPAENICQAA